MHGGVCTWREGVHSGVCAWKEECVDEAGGIYSDIPDLPSDLPPDIPPTDSPVRMTHKSYIIVYAYF